MKVYKVSRVDKIGWCEDIEMVVISKDEKYAERFARWSSEDFKKAKLKIELIDISREQTILIANKGA